MELNVGHASLTTNVLTATLNRSQFIIFTVLIQSNVREIVYQAVSYQEQIVPLVHLTAYNANNLKLNALNVMIISSLIPSLKNVFKLVQINFILIH